MGIGIRKSQRFCRSFLGSLFTAGGPGCVGLCEWESAAFEPSRGRHGAKNIAQAAYQFEVFRYNHGAATLTSRDLPVR